MTSSLSIRAVSSTGCSSIRCSPPTTSPLPSDLFSASSTPWKSCYICSVLGGKYIPVQFLDRQGKYNSEPVCQLCFNDLKFKKITIFQPENGFGYQGLLREDRFVPARRNISFCLIEIQPDSRGRYLHDPFIDFAPQFFRKTPNSARKELF
jgi:hypothetical protein